jgi:hypothetical protein
MFSSTLMLSQNIQYTGRCAAFDFWQVCSMKQLFADMHTDTYQLKKGYV